MNTGIIIHGARSFQTRSWASSPPETIKFCEFCYREVPQREWESHHKAATHRQAKKFAVARCYSMVPIAPAVLPVVSLLSAMNKRPITPRQLMLELLRGPFVVLNDVMISRLPLTVEPTRDITGRYSWETASAYRELDAHREVLLDDARRRVSGIDAGDEAARATPVFSHKWELLRGVEARLSSCEVIYNAYPVLVGDLHREPPLPAPESPEPGLTLQQLEARKARKAPLPTVFWHAALAQGTEATTRCKEAEELDWAVAFAAAGCAHHVSIARSVCQKLLLPWLIRAAHPVSLTQFAFRSGWGREVDYVGSMEGLLAGFPHVATVYSRCSGELIVMTLDSAALERCSLSVALRRRLFVVDHGEPRALQHIACRSVSVTQIVLDLMRFPDRRAWLTVSCPAMRERRRDRRSRSIRAWRALVATRVAVSDFIDAAFADQFIVDRVTGRIRATSAYSARVAITTGASAFDFETTGSSYSSHVADSGAVLHRVPAEIAGLSPLSAAQHETPAMPVAVLGTRVDEDQVETDDASPPLHAEEDGGPSWQDEELF